MAITIRTPTVTNAGFGNSATTIAVPSGTTTGDLLVLILQVSKESLSAPTTPTGFTQVGATATVGTGANGASKVCYRFAASEPATYSISQTGGGTIVPFMYALSGVDTTTPFDVNPTWAASTAGTTAVAPSITTSTPGAVLLTCHAVLGSTGPNSWSTPSGMTVGVVGRSGNYENAAVFSQTLTSTGATGTRTSTANGSNSNTPPQGLSLAVRPAVAAAAGGGDFFPFLGFGQGVSR